MDVDENMVSEFLRDRLQISFYEADTMARDLVDHLGCQGHQIVYEDFIIFDDDTVDSVTRRVLAMHKRRLGLRVIG